MTMDPFLLATIFLFLAFGPSLFYLRWVRNLEQYDREPVGKVLRAFGWGAIGSIIWVTIFYMLVLGAGGAAYGYIEESFADQPEMTGEVAGLVLLAVILAPLIEEFTKMWGVSGRAGVRDQIGEVEDAMIYGAAIGLGFAATENLMYGFTAFTEEGTGTALATLSLRAISSTLLHTSASALAGYGVGRVLVLGESSSVKWKYYGLAVLLHAAFNGFAVMGEVLELAGVSFLLVLGLAWYSFSFVRNRIVDLDTYRLEKIREERLYGHAGPRRPTAGVGYGSDQNTGRSYEYKETRTTFPGPTSTSRPHGRSTLPSYSNRTRGPMVSFPQVLNCPLCSTKLRVKQPGNFRCARCKKVSRVDGSGRVTTEALPPPPRSVAPKKAKPKPKPTPQTRAEGGQTLDLKVVGPKGRDSRVTVPRSLTVAQFIEATRSHFGLAPRRYVLLREDKPLPPRVSLDQLGLNDWDQVRLVERG